MTDEQAPATARKQSPPRFVQPPVAVIQDRRLGDQALRLLLLLAWYQGDKENCWPSEATLGGLMGVDERTIRRYKTQLLQLGYLKQEQRFNTSNLYVVTWFPPERDSQSLSDYAASQTGQNCPTSPDRDDRLTITNELYKSNTVKDKTSSWTTLSGSSDDLDAEQWLSESDTSSSQLIPTAGTVGSNLGDKSHGTITRPRTGQKRPMPPGNPDPKIVRKCIDMRDYIWDSTGKDQKARDYLVANWPKDLPSLFSHDKQTWETLEAARRYVDQSLQEYAANIALAVDSPSETLNEVVGYSDSRRTAIEAQNAF